MLDYKARSTLLLYILHSQAISRASTERHIILIHAWINIAHPSFWDELVWTWIYQRVRMLQIGRHSDRYLSFVGPVDLTVAGASYPFWNDILVILDRFVWRYTRQSVHDSITEASYGCQPTFQHTQNCRFTDAYRRDSLIIACSNWSRSSCAQVGTRFGHSLMISESSSLSADLSLNRERM
jgi:hypothetical protein